MTRETTMATARIRAPDTMGTRAAKGQGRFQNATPAGFFPETLFPVSPSLRSASATLPKNARFGAGSAARFSSAPGLRTNSVSWTIVHLECRTYCRAIEVFGVERWNRDPKANDRLKVHFFPDENETGRNSSPSSILPSSILMHFDQAIPAHLARRGRLFRRSLKASKARFKGRWRKRWRRLDENGLQLRRQSPLS